MIHAPDSSAVCAPRFGRSTSGTTPIWADETSEPAWDSLHKHLNTDVCIVGGGIAGLTAAYHLTRAGRDVVVLDAGGGETRRSSGHLTWLFDDRLAQVEQLHGTDALRLAVRSHQAAIDLIERIVTEERISCDFERVDGYLLPASTDGAGVLDAELAAAQRAGLADVCLEHADGGHALHVPGQAQFNPLAYLQGLARAIRTNGGQMFRARVVDIGRGDGRDVRTSSGFRVTCNEVVVATHTPILDRLGIHSRQVAWRSYMIGATIPRGLVPHALFWDTGSPYHYARVTPTRDPHEEVLLVGGEDHRTGEPDEGTVRFARLEAWMRERFVGVGAVRWRWSGQILQQVDHLAFIGRDPAASDGTWVISGQGGNGLTAGTIGGRLVAEGIAGASSDYATLYDPRRRSFRTVGRIAREGLHTAAQYRSLLSPGDVTSRADILPGTGAIVRDGLTKTAVYRDHDGMTHEFAALCTYSGCVVQWNQTERSWDCPCHGSRYGLDGRVLNGPAVVPLEARGSGEIPLLHPFRHDRLEQYAFRMVPSVGGLR